ncbi:hypothetical protein BLD25_02580 [Candidatus Gracilibacteria bacterium GN02-872]|nr:hypothetical protein BLD25_02580 [Candidatus Gracilibacteria bacterium GN02-872]
MKNALIRDFSPETRERGGTKISNIIKAVTLGVGLALTQGAHAKSDDNIVTVDIDGNTFTQGVHTESDNNIVTVDIDGNTFTYNLKNEDILTECDKYMENVDVYADCVTGTETAFEAQEDLINARLNESEIGLANSERELASSKRELASSKRELASSNARLKNAQARNEQTKKDMNVAKNQMNIAEKEANRVYKQERKKVLAN